MNSQRIYSLDLLKILAIFGVIVFHTYPFAGINPEFYRLYRSFWGFNVPVFFIISGYLFGMKISNGDNLALRFSKNMKRLIFILVAWSVLYLTLPFGHFSHGLIGAFFVGWYDMLLRIIHNPAAVFDGAAPHLWFLIALIIGMAIAYPFIKLQKFIALIAIGGGLYTLGLITGAYSWTPVGFSIVMNTRDGPFQSVLFIAIGVVMAVKGSRPSFRWAALVFACGLFFQMSEIALLEKFIPHNQMAGGEYYVGTIPYATGLVMVALSQPAFGRRLNVHKLAPYILGVYMIQFIVITYIVAVPGISSSTAFAPIIINNAVNSIFWQVLYTPLIFLISVSLAVLLARLPYTRRLVLS